MQDIIRELKSGSLKQSVPESDFKLMAEDHLRQIESLKQAENDRKKFYEGDEYRDLRQRVLTAESELVTIRQNLKAPEMLRQEIVNVRNENIVSYKMI